MPVVSWTILKVGSMDDGRLELSEVIKQQIGNSDFAFLSAMSNIHVGHAALSESCCASSCRDVGGWINVRCGWYGGPQIDLYGICEMTIIFRWT